MKDGPISQLRKVSNLKGKEKSILKMLCLSGYIHNISSASKAHGTSQKRGQKHYKSHTARKATVKGTLLEMAADTRLEQCQYQWTS